MRLADGTEITSAQNDAKYIEQGKLMMPRIDPEKIEEETRRMNEGKNGRPFAYPDSVFIALP